MEDKRQTDRELLTAIVEQRDKQAFRTLYDRYEKTVITYLRDVTEHETAADLSQNLWMYVWENAGKLIYPDERDGSVRNLLLDLSMKRVADFYRTSGYRRAVSMELTEMLVNCIPAGTAGPEEDLYTIELQEIIEEVLKRYLEIDQEIFRCRKEQQLSPAEVARRFHLSEGTIHKKVSAIMQSIRMALDAKGYYYVMFLLYMLWNQPS